MTTDLLRPHFKKPASRSPVNEYAELKQLIQQKGLLDKQPIYYVYKILLTLGLLALSLIIFLLVIDNLWLQLLNAVYLAFVSTQMGFIGHDAGHRQIFRTRWKNDIVGLVHSNLLLGVSYGWWTNKHNQHHANPNHFDLDPDINVPVLAFSEEQALSKQRFLQPMMKYQAYFFFPLLSLAAFSLRMGSLRFLLLQKKGKFPPPEALLLVIHFVLYFGLLFYLLDVWQALLFIAVHQMLFGLYMGSVFAPNHKGMLTQGKDSRLSFLHQQVFTARNVKAHALTDFWYGGLNYQIEHHLFPSMSRNKLSEAQKIIKAFCQVHSIAYYETGVLQSYREILQYLHQVSAPLRK